MATLHLMVGLPCSGKTTYARQLANDVDALLLTPDIWHLKLFGNDTEHEDHERNHDTIEKIMCSIASQILKLGVDVILDFGCIVREQRDEIRQIAVDASASFKIHYMDVPIDELWLRLEERNKQPADGVFIIPKEMMELFISFFQPPTSDELL